jgi:signal transduction histidine kinase
MRTVRSTVDPLERKLWHQMWSLSRCVVTSVPATVNPNLDWSKSGMSRTKSTHTVIRQLELATAVHDLRNRMSIAQCEVHQLRRQLETFASDASVLQALTLVARSLEQTNALLEDLMDVTANEVRLPPTTCSPTDLVKLTRDVIAETASDHRVELATTMSSVTGAWHAQRVMVVLRILLDYAIGHSPNGGCVTTTIEASTDWAVIVITDNAPRMPTEDLPHLFEPFHGAHDLRSRAADLGLGLPVARLIVEQYGGVLDAQSSETKGNSFKIRLPRTCA